MNKSRIKKSVRNSNLELLRLISMALIISLHFLQSLPPTYNVMQGLVNSVLEILCNWATLGVGCFFLISGYFLSSDKVIIKFKSVLNIVAAVFIYSFLSKLILLIMSHDLTGLTFVKCVCRSILAPFTFSYWFITVYLFVYLCSPYLCQMLSVLSKTNYRKVLVVLTLLILVQKTFFRTGGSTDLILYGLYTFFIAFYLHRLVSEREENVIYRYSKYFSIIFLGAFIVDSFMQTHYLLWSQRIISFPQFIMAICLFLCFKRAKPFQNLLINHWAKYTLAIYIVHYSGLFNMCGWKLLGSELFLNSYMILLILVETIFVIMVIVPCIDFVRLRAFNYICSQHYLKLFISKMDGYINL